MHSTHSVGQAVSDGSENLQAALPPLQHGQHAGQGGNGGQHANVAPAPAQPPAWLQQAAERNPHLTPELAQEQAKAETAKALVEVQREATRHKELELQIEEIKQGKQAQPKPSDPNNIVTRFATMADTNIAKTEFLLEPYLPRASVVGFYGRGETAKSSLLATLAAQISDRCSTLWITCEENETKVRARHLKGIQLQDGNYASAGAEYTISTFEAVVKSRDAQGRAQTSSFNTYEHLEATIVKVKTDLENLPAEIAKPLRLVVIDTAVALTTWGKGENSNDDAGVKRLLAYLRYVAEKHDVTIALIGHSNKGKHEHFADSVMGATAWVNSPRISFLHAKHMQLENHIIVRVAKSNEIPHMAQIFSVHMVHELHQFMDGPKAGLMKVWPLTRVWGAQQAADLWDEVTRKAVEEDDDTPAAQNGRITTVQRVIEKLMDLVCAAEPGVLVTRDDVQAAMGKPILRKHWVKVDDTLLQFSNQYRVVIQKDENNGNRCFYSKQA